jgi:hypothetical protein
MTTIGIENLITTTVLEFVKTYLLDLIYNNTQLIESMNLTATIKDLEKESVYFSKLIMHFEYFYKYR